MSGSFLPRLRGFFSPLLGFMQGIAMDKATYFQSVYEAQFALGKKMGAAVSAQILALEAFFSAALTGIFDGGPLWASHPTPGQCCNNVP